VDKAINAKSIEIYRYEEDSARGQSPKARLLKVLKSTDIYLGIFGSNYGSPYPSDEFDGSIVEWEFDTVRQQGNAEVFAFSKATSAQGADPRQQKFLARLGSFTDGVWLKQFGDIEQFTTEVRDAVQNWSLRYWDMYANADTSKPGFATASIAGLAGAALMGVVWGISADALTIGDALQLVAIVLIGAACGILVSNR
jgi:hypothetical protein